MVNCASYFTCVWKNTSKCEWCSRNEDLPIREDNYAVYTYVCPLGEKNCSSDPARVRIQYPTWYKRLYGDAEPQDIAEKHCSTICPKFFNKSKEN